MTDFSVEEALQIADANDHAYKDVPSVSRTLAAEVRRLRDDRDSWCEQASARVKDWDDMRRRAEAAEAGAWRWSEAAGEVTGTYAGKGMVLVDLQKYPIGTKLYAHPPATPVSEAGADLRKLQRFVGNVLPMDDECISSFDGGDLQDLAENAGLLVPTEVTEPCGERCNCAGYGEDFPMTCYRPSPTLMRAIRSTWPPKGQALDDLTREQERLGLYDGEGS